MNKFVSLLTGVALTACAVSVSTASAQEGPYPVTSGRTIIELGGGVQFLDFGDTNFTFFTNEDGKTVRKQKNGELDDYGGVASGSIHVPLGRTGNRKISLTISGFVANVENTRRINCSSTNDLDCTVNDIVNNPNQLNSWTFQGFTTRTEREADFWGGSTELVIGRDRPKRPRYEGGFLFDVYHFGIGADVRGIDQDTRLTLHTYDMPNYMIRYDETLDTTYYGGYLSITGEYNILGYFGIGGSWGIRSFATFRAGLYGTDVDYTGRFIQADNSTRLNLSDNEVAFIGSASFETRKQFGGRSSLSLVTNYDYFSYVPRMRYADTNEGTYIDDDDTLAVSTQIRFNYGLGPDALYDEIPLK